MSMVVGMIIGAQQFPGLISGAQLTCGADGHHCELTSNNSVAAVASGCVVDR